MLTKFQSQKLAHLFHLYDTNKSGELDRGDFEEYASNVARVAGVPTDTPQFQEILSQCVGVWEELLKLCDKNQDQKIELNEWLVARDALHSNQDSASRLHGKGDMLFTLLDQDKDGKLTRDDYLRYFQMRGVDVGTHGAAYTRLVFGDKTVLTKDEFKALYTEFFFGDDPNAAGSWFLGLI